MSEIKETMTRRNGKDERGSDFELSEIEGTKKKKGENKRNRGIIK